MAMDKKIRRHPAGEDAKLMLTSSVFSKGNEKNSPIIYESNDTEIKNAAINDVVSSDKLGIEITSIKVSPTKAEDKKKLEESTDKELGD